MISAGVTFGIMLPIRTSLRNWAFNVWSWKHSGCGLVGIRVLGFYITVDWWN